MQIDIDWIVLSFQATFMWIIALSLQCINIWLTSNWVSIDILWICVCVFMIGITTSNYVCDVFITRLICKAFSSGGKHEEQSWKMFAIAKVILEIFQYMGSLISLLMLWLSCATIQFCSFEYDVLFLHYHAILFLYTLYTLVYSYGVYNKHNCISDNNKE